MTKALVPLIIAVALAALSVCAQSADIACGPTTGIEGIIGISATTNAHAELPNSDVYMTRLGCTLSGALLGCALNCSVNPTCAPAGTGWLRLSSATNAHASTYANSVYPYGICCSMHCQNPAPALNCIWHVGSCPTNQAQIVRLSSVSNAHVSTGTVYPEVLCCAKVSECSDGIDNDGNGLIDYPNDPGCDGPDDPTECTSWTNSTFCFNYQEYCGNVTALDNCGIRRTVPCRDCAEGQPKCRADCSYDIDGLCHAACIGVNDCVMVDPRCEGRPVGSLVTVGDHSILCCAGGSMPALYENDLRYNTTRDRIASARISTTKTGQVVKISIVNFG